MAPPNEYDDEKCTALTLFGGDNGWDSAEWIASDDRVRGGRSESHLYCKENTARFYGKLDIQTLGRAGFASQRTTGHDREWDLSEYAGIQLDIAKGDKKRYTFILKDDILPPKEESGREQATISWECDFELPPQTEPGKTHDKSVFAPFTSFNPTYRGKLVKDADPMDLKQIKRMSIMMRSFFGSQEGDFSLTIKSISAVCSAPSAIRDGAVWDKKCSLSNLENGLADVGLDRDAYFHLHIDLWTVETDLNLHRKTLFTLAGLGACSVIYQLARTI